MAVFNVNIADTWQAFESIATRAVRSRSLFETLILSEAITRQKTWNRLLSENLLPLDGAGPGGNYVLWLKDTLTLAEATQQQQPKVVAVSDALTLLSTTQMSQSHSQAVSDQIMLVDIIVKSYDLRLLENQLGFQVDAFQVPGFQADPGISDEVIVEVGTWHRHFTEDLWLAWTAQCRNGLHGFLILRDSWHVVRDFMLPEMYRLEQFNRIVDFLELYGEVYNKVLNRIDALVTLMSIAEVPPEYMQNLVNLIGLNLNEVEITENYKYPATIEEIRKTVDIWKIRGTIPGVNRIPKVRYGFESDTRIPAKRVIRLDVQGKISAGGRIKDKLFWNHHTLQIIIQGDYPDAPTRMKDYIPSGVKTWFAFGDVNSGPAEFNEITIIEADDHLTALIIVDELLTLLDATTWQVFWNRLFSENLTLGESTGRQMNFLRRFSDLLILTDGRAFGVTHKMPGDTWIGLDGPKKQVNKPLPSETLTLVDTLFKGETHRMAEAMTLASNATVVKLP